MSDKIDHIADLEQRLYARDPENIPKRKFGILRPLKQKTSSTWGDIKKIERVTPHASASGYKKFFIFSTVFFVLAFVVALFSFYRGVIVLSSKNVEVTILGNSFVNGGEDLLLQVEIANKNSKDLSNVSLVVSYPKGATDTSESDNIRIEKKIGVIPSGKTKSEEFSIILYGEKGTVRNIKANLSYKLAGSNSLFQKETSAPVTISSSPVELTVDAPTSIVPNQSFTINIKNSFAGEKPLGDAILRVEYPNGFVFDKAVPAPISGNNVWTLGSLAKGNQINIAIQGRLLGEEQDEKAFRIYLGAPENDTSSKISVAYNSVLQTISLSKPFLNSSISIDDKKDDTVSLPIGSSVSGAVVWSNNSGFGIKDPIFTLTLNGQSIDKKSIKVEKGFYDQLENVITWSSDSDGGLSEISDGQSGTLPFSFNTITPTTGSREITLSLSVKGNSKEDESEKVVTNIDQKRIVFASNIDFSAQSLYSIGPIKNTGPFPPKANQNTTYTITWTIKPSESALNKLVVSATLPNGSIWNGTIIPQSEDIGYNPGTKTVTWNVGSLPKATPSLKYRSVSFQVSARPTVFQIGSSVKLLGETSVSGIDTSTNTPISTKAPELTSVIKQDPIYVMGQESVLP